jgi:hypothetical protein
MVRFRQLHPVGAPRAVEPVYPRPAHVVQQGMAGGLVLPSQRRQPITSLYGSCRDGEAREVEVGGPCLRAAQAAAATRRSEEAAARVVAAFHR